MIEVKKMIFAYKKDGKPAVDDISFEVEDGEIFGFLGPSGAGKSTTQKILIGLLSGYHGLAKVMGKDISHWGKEYYEKVGVSFELPNHYQKLTARENLELFGKLFSSKTRDVDEMLDMVGLKEDADKRVSDFSKGMQMRLNFARSLLNNPQLIFLDEPTSGMDPVNARKIKDAIREQKQRGKTVFLTTHNMTVADELCDRVAFIVDGKIVLIDSPKKLKIEQGERVVKLSYYPKDKWKDIQEIRTPAVSETGAQDTSSTETKSGSVAISEAILEAISEEFPLAGLGQNQRFLNLISCSEIETIHTKESTLEDIFIRVTGRNL